VAGFLVCITVYSCLDLRKKIVTLKLRIRVYACNRKGYWDINEMVFKRKCSVNYYDTIAI